MDFRVRFSIFFLLLIASRLSLAAVDISNPMNLVFVADRIDKIIDVIDVKESRVVFRIDLPYRVDQLVVTPNAPLLFFTNIEEQLVVAYNLKEQRIDREFALPMVPRHMVLDATGKYLGITDDVDGGIVILSTYGREITYENAEFPPTSDVLFDPNEIELYYTNNQSGSLGLLDLNSYQTIEIDLVEVEDSQHRSQLSAPSRSLDSRYIYVADQRSGDVFSLNAYSSIIYKTFNIGASPVRPYTTPDGVFLYMLDSEKGRFVAVEQNRFTEHVDIELGAGIDLVTVGRFDRMNLLLSTHNSNYVIYDNFAKEVLERGQFEAIPVSAQGSIDGRSTYIAFSDMAKVGLIDLEGEGVSYIDATNNGAGAFTVGATNNVCH